MKQFVGGFVAGAIVFGAIGVKLITDAEKARVRWMSARYYDNGDHRPDSGYVVAQGTLLGPGMSGEAFLKVTCSQATNACDTSELSSYTTQPRLVFLNDDSLEIKRWTDDQIVAESSPVPEACNRIRIVVDRVSKATHYYRIPQSTQDKEFCKIQENKTFDWYLGDVGI